MALFGVMTPSQILNPEDDKFYEYGVSEMKELWKAWDEDVESVKSQVHPAILNNDLGVAALLPGLNGKCTKNLSGIRSSVPWLR